MDYFKTPVNEKHLGGPLLPSIFAIPINCMGQKKFANTGIFNQMQLLRYIINFFIDIYQYNNLLFRVRMNMMVQISVNTVHLCINLAKQKSTNLDIFPMIFQIKDTHLKTLAWLCTKSTRSWNVMYCIRHIYNIQLELIRKYAVM